MGLQQEVAAGEGAKLHLYLQLLPITWVTAWAPLPAQWISKCNVLEPSWNTPDPTPIRAVFHEAHPCGAKRLGTTGFEFNSMSYIKEISHHRVRGNWTNMPLTRVLDHSTEKQCPIVIIAPALESDKLGSDLSYAPAVWPKSGNLLQFSYLWWLI